MSSRRRPRSASGPPWWLIILIAAVLAVLAAYLWNRNRDRPPPSTPSDTSVSPSAASGAGSGNGSGSGAGSGAATRAAAASAASGAQAGAGNASGGSLTVGAGDGASAGGGRERSAGPGGPGGAPGATSRATVIEGPRPSGAGLGVTGGGTSASGAPASGASASGTVPGTASRIPGAGAASGTTGGGAASGGPRSSAQGRVGEASGAQQPRYPVPPAAHADNAQPLPPLADSDPAIAAQLLDLADRKKLVEYGNLQDLTRRFVVTVDHLPREMIPAQYSALQRIPGPLAVARQDGRIVLKPENFARYTPFVAFAESLGPRAMAAIYLRFYPLLQQEYRAMGFPQGYFNDRVIEAIDDMLSAPQVTGPIELVQPRVHYRFADPALESLSAGRKIMIRIGPENAARLAKVLRGIRAALVQ